MSDPRHSDRRRADPLRRLDLQGSSRTGTMWTWLAAILAAIVMAGLVIGYIRTDLASHQSDEAITTGSAPPAPQPSPGSGDQTGNVPQPVPPTPATPAPAPDL